MKNIPLLGKSAPSLNRSLTAFNIMHSPVVTFPFIAKVDKIYEALERTTHSGYPVLNGFGRPVGIIERDALITMIEHKAWYNREPSESPAFTRRKDDSIRTGRRQPAAISASESLQQIAGKDHIRDSINDPPSEASMKAPLIDNEKQPLL